MGAILEQKGEEACWLTVASWSKKLLPSQRNYSATDKEWLAVVECVTRVWRHWLLGKEFELRTDHGALREILTKKGEEFTLRQLRWFERLEPFSFTVKHIKGADNLVPDALSRTPCFYDIHALELGTPLQTLCIEDIQEAIAHDERYNHLIDDTTLQQHLGVYKENGVLKTKEGIVCVPNHEALRFILTLEAHDPPFAGHFDHNRTYALLKQAWWWPNMRAMVRRVVENCPTCQMNASKRSKDQGPLRPINAAYPWEVVTIDFVSGFAPSAKSRHTACCVVCDRFTRMIHLEACRDHITTREAVGLVLRMIIARHGCPRIILSDKGTTFDSELWREVWQMLGTRVSLATTHHPQTNGLTERLNRTLIALIRKYTQAYPTRWAEFLPIFEFAYNRSKHSTTGAAPFQAYTGHLPPIPAQLLTTPRHLQEPNDVTISAHVQDLRRVLVETHEMIKEHETRVWDQVRSRENETRGKHSYQEGDEVLLYWVPFRTFNEGHKKHHTRYVGPFTVKRVIQPDVLELNGLPGRMPTHINIQYIHPYRRDKNPQLEQLRHDAPPTDVATS